MTVLVKAITILLIGLKFNLGKVLKIETFFIICAGEKFVNIIYFVFVEKGVDIDIFGGSGTKFPNRYKKMCGLPATFSIYKIFEIFIEPQINLQDQETYQNPILNSRLKSNWA